MKKLKTKQRASSELDPIREWLVKHRYVDNDDRDSFILESAIGLMQRADNLYREKFHARNNHQKSS